MYDRAISAPTSPTKMEQGGQRSWEEPSWMGSSPRVLSQDMKATVSRSLQTLPSTSTAHCFEPGRRGNNNNNNNNNNNKRVASVHESNTAIWSWSRIYVICAYKMYICGPRHSVVLLMFCVWILNAHRSPKSLDRLDVSSVALDLQWVSTL